MKVKGIIIIVLIILAVILIAQNTEVVPVQILFWQILMSRIVLIALMLVLGFGIGFILAKVTGKRRSSPKEN
ncbi:MAG: LapA family protein [candidate division WOR-3 bacterium]|nr:MAG: LapA family protein [candidate division WOR-3 bacterium]